MNPFDLIPLFAKYGLSPILGLICVYFYVEKAKGDAAHEAKFTGLIERYHAQVNEQVHTLALIEERLDK